MEGPAVKWFVTAPSISWSMLTSEYLSGRHGRFPEDAGARLTMERLRRRIRLICAGCSEEQSRMTPLRRELPPSRGASRPDPETGRRIASARTLQSCSHRAVADAARESRSHYPRPLLASVTMVTRLGDRRHGDRRSLAVAEEMPVAAMQALLRPPRVADDLVGLALAAVRQRAADGGSVPIVPGGLDQDPPGVTVAGFGQRSAALRLARGVLARHEPEVGHEFARPAEALEVHYLGQQDDRRQRVDPAEAAEPAHGLAIGRGGGQGLEFFVEFRLPRQRLLQREHGGLERALERRQFEPLLTAPSPVGVAPVLAGEVGVPVAGQELEHAMPPAENIAADVVAAADEIAHGLLALVEDVDGGELASAEQSHELRGVPAVGLDPLPGASWA